MAIVIKTGQPLRRVFLKETGAEFQSLEFAEGELSGLPYADPEDDLRFAERLEERLAERLETAREQWEQEALARERAAREEGRREGERAGREEIARRGAELASVIAALRQAREELLREGELAAVELALTIARRFVDNAALLGSDLIRQTIKSAVRLIVEKDKVVIRVNPDDLEEVRGHQDDIIFIGDGIGKLEIRRDRTIDRGGCVVETEAGNIDARIDSRFSEIEKALRQLYAGAGAADQPPAESPGGAAQPEAADD